MIKFILKLIFRNLVKSKFYSLAVIVGFSIAITMTTLNVMFLIHEYSTDSFHEKEQRICRLLVRNSTLRQGNEYTAMSSFSYGQRLGRDFPEIEQVTFVRPAFTEQELIVDSQKHRVPLLFYADSSFFKLLDFKAIQGDLASCLRQPNSIVLTSSEALKYYGTADVLGASIVYKGEHYTVTAVLEDTPSNSSLSFDVLVSLSTLGQFPDFRNEGITYLLLHNGSSSAQLEKLINEKTDVRDWQNEKVDFLLEGLSEVYYHTYSTQDSAYRLFKSRSKTFLYIIILLIGLTMTTAVFNHITFTRAKLTMQTKQALVHRILGGLPMQSQVYYFMECLIILGIAYVITLVGVPLILPYYNTAVDAAIPIEYFTPQKLFMVGFGLVFPISLLFGIVIQSVSTNKDNFVTKLFGGSGLDSLVLVQITFSIGLLGFFTIIYSQVQYIKNYPLGYAAENLISISLEELPRGFNTEILKTEFLKHHSITRVSMCSGSPISGFSMDTDRINGEDYTIRSLEGDAAYLEVFQFDLMEGRNYDARLDSSTTSIIINQAAAQLFNVKVGDQLPGYYNVVIGIVRNFNYGSLKEPIGPVMIFTNFKSQRPSRIILEAKAVDADLLNAVKATWSKIAPGTYFRHKILKDEFLIKHNKDFSFIRLIVLTSVSSFIITLFGIAGLSFYTAQKRTKEMAIRKIHGASRNEIIMIFICRIGLGIIIAALIATPLSIYASLEWLQNFVFRTDVKIWMIVIPIGITFLLVMMATLYHIVVVANKNPATTLKYE